MDCLNGWNGHDALVESITIDHIQKSVSVRLLAYRDEDAGDRNPIELRFSDVESVTTSANLDRIADNSSAGTVNHWHLAEGPGTSFLYLIEGYVAVSARSGVKLVARVS